MKRTVGLPPFSTCATGVAQAQRPSGMLGRVLTNGANARNLHDWAVKVHGETRSEALTNAIHHLWTCTRTLVGLSTIIITLRVEIRKLSSARPIRVASSTLAGRLHTGGSERQTPARLLLAIQESDGTLLLSQTTEYRHRYSQIPRLLDPQRLKIPPVSKF